MLSAALQMPRGLMMRGTTWSMRSRPRAQYLAAALAALVFLLLGGLRLFSFVSKDYTGLLAAQSKFFDERGNGDPSGLSFAPGAAQRRASQAKLFQQKLDWRAAHPIDNVTFGFLYYLGSPIPGAIEQAYLRELALSIHALACSSFEDKNVVVVTDTEESRAQLQVALHGVGKGRTRAHSPSFMFPPHFAKVASMLL